MSFGRGELSFRQVFQNFARFGEAKSEGHVIQLSQIDAWFRQAEIFGEKVDTNTTTLGFKKFRKHGLNQHEFKIFAKDIAILLEMEHEEFLDKLTSCQTPKPTNVTKLDKNPSVRRLTTPSVYTAAQRERLKELEEERIRTLAEEEEVEDADGILYGKICDRMD